MRPLDPRLLRYARAARTFFAVGVVLGLVRTVLIIAFCWLLSHVIVDAIAGRTLDSLLPAILALAAVGLLRAVMIWAMDAAASRAAALVKSQLRRRLVAGLGRLGPGWLARRNRVDVLTTAGQGLDALDGYFSLLLPQLILTAIATPLVIVTIVLQDPTSGILVLLALPLIPVFMILIGLATQTVQRRQWVILGRLASRFIDVVGGLATLKIFGRQHRQAKRIETLTESYRTETMKVLRMSFLSGFSLELIGSLSVALVAVSVGLRLVDGSLGLGVGLFVLLLAPEAFLPLRQVGANYHAAADGVAAAEHVFGILDAAATSATTTPGTATGAMIAPASPDGRSVGLVPAGLRFTNVSVHYEGRTAVDRFAAHIRPGRLTVLNGPSGAGKSSLVAALLGFVPFEGEIDIGGIPSAPRDRGEERRSRTAWAGQGAGLLAGTVASNVALGAATPDDALVRRSLALAALGTLDPGAPVSTTGTGLSGGQAERVVAARAIYRCLDRLCPVLVLDEPSAALDAETEAQLLRGLRSLASDGHTVLVVSHRAAVAAAADDVVRLGVTVNA
jgi:ATP-binding cassette subfamily C protein CydD